MHNATIWMSMMSKHNELGEKNKPLFKRICYQQMLSGKLPLNTNVKTLAMIESFIRAK